MECENAVCKNWKVCIYSGGTAFGRVASKSEKNTGFPTKLYISLILGCLYWWKVVAFPIYRILVCFPLLGNLPTVSTLQDVIYQLLRAQTAAYSWVAWISQSSLQPEAGLQVTHPIPSPPPQWVCARIQCFLPPLPCSWYASGYSVSPTHLWLVMWNVRMRSPNRVGWYSPALVVGIDLWHLLALVGHPFDGGCPTPGSCSRVRSRTVPCIVWD